jgi:adenylate kinase
LIIFGPPAVGKGTQAARLSSAHAIPHLSTGEMLRAAIAQGSRIGKRAKAIMDKGGLVPDDVVVKIVDARTLEADCASGFILDGFPRTLRQAKAFDRILKRRKLGLDAVIVIEADEAALIKRVENRANEARAQGKPVRSDDDPEVFKQRLKTYHAETAPVLPYYRRQKKIRTIDGMQPIDDVTAQIERALAEPPKRSWFQFFFASSGAPAV